MKGMNIFFSGIAGSGMSALAAFMADKGHSIAGSDRDFDRNIEHPLKKMFLARGFSLSPQDGRGIHDMLDLAVFSTAVESDHPEFRKTRELAIPVKTRPDFLREIASSYDTIAISGTSGKSTASGMLAFLMRELGLHPNFIGGGRVRHFRTPLNPGNSLSGSSRTLVIEACESDGSITSFTPEHSVILNLDLDHHPIPETAAMFETLVDRTSGMVIINGDDRHLARLGHDKALTFSLVTPSRYQAKDLVFNRLMTEFSLAGTLFRLSLPGQYNLYNALACITLLAELGVSMPSIAEILPRFRGIDRRFDVCLDDGEHLVVDDYAHNPHKIASLMETMMRLAPRVCYVFQPHGFGPTRMMKREYIDVFTRNLRDGDHLVLLPIYYAGGRVSKDISSDDLADEIRRGGKSAQAVHDRRGVPDIARGWKACVVLGARDETLGDLARQIAGLLSSRQPSEKAKTLKF